jgi:sugar/nucleoside kinase (ribokinase family)
LADIVVAGHICLDLIPQILTGGDWAPGKLIETGPLTASTGGAVANVGLALEKLGQPTRLIAKVGRDSLGDAIRATLENQRTGLSSRLGTATSTSYTVVLSPPNRDRTFLHHPGGNNEFGAEEVRPQDLIGATHFHFGYPPLMARMYETPDELARVFQTAKAAGLTTSLDMALPDPESTAGRANWGAILNAALPFVDLFLPSEEELELIGGQIPTGFAGELTVKCGDRGLLHRGEITPCFPANVVGTTGSGDATIAGILYGFVRGWDLKHCLVAGCAVGACSTEAAGATAGIPTWEEVFRRFKLPVRATVETAG